MSTAITLIGVILLIVYGMAGLLIWGFIMEKNRNFNTKRIILFTILCGPGAIIGGIGYFITQPIEKFIIKAELKIRQWLSKETTK